MSGSHLSKDFFDLMCSSHRLGPSTCRRICAPFTALPHAARCSLRARALSALLCLIVSSRWPMRRHASMSCCPRAALSLSPSAPLSQLFSPSSSLSQLLSLSSSLSSSLSAPLSAPLSSLSLNSLPVCPSSPPPSSKSIGECKSKQEEDKILQHEVSVLKQRFTESLSPKKSKEAIVRMMYAEMLGHDASFAHIHAINMTQQTSLVSKRIGYLASALCLHPNHELVTLLVNTMRRDLSSSNHVEVCAALIALPKLVNVETLPALQVEGARDLFSPRMSHPPHTLHTSCITLRALHALHISCIHRRTCSSLRSSRRLSRSSTTRTRLCARRRSSRSIVATSSTRRASASSTRSSGACSATRQVSHTSPITQLAHTRGRAPTHAVAHLARIRPRSHRPLLFSI